MNFFPLWTYAKRRKDFSNIKSPPYPLCLVVIFYRLKTENMLFLFATFLSLSAACITGSGGTEFLLPGFGEASAVAFTSSLLVIFRDGSLFTEEVGAVGVGEPTCVATSGAFMEL